MDEGKHEPTGDALSLNNKSEFIKGHFTAKGKIS